MLFLKFICKIIDNLLIKVIATKMGVTISRLNFKDTIAQQSPKLRQMADIALRDGWGDAQVQAHHNAMLTTLQNALGPHLNMRD